MLLSDTPNMKTLTLLRPILIFHVGTILLGQTYRVEAVAGADHAKEGPGLSVPLSAPFDIVDGRDGMSYISDNFDHGIRRIAPDFTVTTIAGNGLCCALGDGGQAREARVGYPAGLAIDLTRNRFYIAQPEHGITRAVDLNTGMTSNIAGNGMLKYNAANENRPATQASISPTWLATDEAGNLFVSDTENGRIY